MKPRSKMFFYLAMAIFLFMGVYTNQKEGNRIMQKTEKKFSANYKNVNDSNFFYHQDTIYYKQAPFTGIQFLLYPNGDTAFLKPFYAGLEEGWIKKWYPNKQLAEKRYYISGRKEGQHQAWWSNGHLKFSYQFENDEFNGVNKEWYESGVLFKLFHYAKGYEEGSQQMFWANGKVRANYIIKNNRRYGLLGTKNCINVADSIAIER